MGIDPVTHKPRADAGAAANGASRYRAAAHLSHTAQWESARLEAEAHLAREAKLRALASPPPPPPTAPAASGLESPTSTLSFSESALFAGAAHDDVRGAARAPALLTLRCYVAEAFGEQHHFGDATAPGFLAGVLLDCSAAGAEQRFTDASTDASVSEQQQEEEEDKGYWSSILNMVNSSMSSSSSSLTSEAVMDPAMYLPAAEEF